MRERLYRSRSDRMIAGVCAGLGDWFGVDPTLVRIGFVLFTLVGGFGVLLYIAMMIVVPEQTAESVAAAEAADFPPDLSDEERAKRWAEREARQAARTARAAGRDHGAMIFGGILVVIGGWFLIKRYLPAVMDDAWPVLLVLLGGVFILGSLRNGSGR